MKLKKLLFIILSLLLFAPFNSYANVFEDIEGELNELPIIIKKSIGFGDFKLKDLKNLENKSEELSKLEEVKCFTLYNFPFVSSMLESKNDFIEDDSVYKAEKKQYIKKNSDFNSPVNLDVIRYFKNIERLSLVSNYDDVIIPNLDEFKNLKNISFEAINIKDFDSLRSCNSLKIVILNEFNINSKNLDVFTNMNLEKFILNNSNIELDDLSFLKNSKDLKKLTLKNIKIKDISMINQFENLEELDLENITIQDFNLKNIKILSLKDCRIENKNALSDLNSLETLSFENTYIDNMEFLAKQNNLKLINLKNTSIKELPNLDNTVLDTLYIDGGKFINLDNLKSCKSLKFVDIKNIETLDSLSFTENSNIEDVNLDNLSINDLKVNENIKDIKLSNLNNINNLESIKDCVNLSTLEIKNLTNLKDLKFLEELKRLYSLKLNDLNNTDIKTLNENLKIAESLNILELENIKANNLLDISNMSVLESLKLKNIKNLDEIYLNKYCNRLSFENINSLKNIEIKKGDGYPIDFMDYDYKDERRFFTTNRYKYEFKNVSLTDLSFLNSYNFKVGLKFEDMNNVDFSQLDSNFDCSYLTVINSKLINFNLVNNFNSLFSLTLDNLDIDEFNLSNRYMNLNSIKILNMPKLKKLNIDINKSKSLKIVNCEELKSINENIKEKPYIEQIHVKDIKLDSLSFLKSIKYPKSIRIKNGQIMDIDKLNELDTISYIEIYDEEIDKTIIDKLLKIPSLQDIIINTESYKGERVLFF